LRDSDSFFENEMESKLEQSRMAHEHPARDQIAIYARRGFGAVSRSNPALANSALANSVLVPENPIVGRRVPAHAAAGRDRHEAGIAG
jgi:hypothetical protein